MRALVIAGEVVLSALVAAVIGGGVFVFILAAAEWTK